MTDPLLAADLAALARDARSGVPTLDDLLRAVGSDRPRGPALLPLVHVFAERVGRAVAGAVALATAGVLLALVTVPRDLPEHFDDFVEMHPLQGWLLGRNIVEVAALALALVGAAQLVAGALASRVIERRMLRASDPSACGHRLVRRVDGWAVALRIAGAASLGILLLDLLLVGNDRMAAYLAMQLARGRWLAPTLLPVLHDTTMMIIAVLPTAAAIGYASANAHGRVARLAHPVLAWTAVAACVGIACAGVLQRLYIDELPQHRRLPDGQLLGWLAVAGAVAVLAATTSFALRRRHVELVRLGGAP